MNLSFEKAFDVVAFIYSGMLQLNDLPDYLNAGESLEVLGLRECDDHCSEKPDDDQSTCHKILATAEGIPADHALRKTDIVRKNATENSQKLGTDGSRMSSSSAASGSEYEVEKDSDNYSDSDDAMPLVTVAKHQKLQRAVDVSKKVQPQNDSNGQKRNKAIASVPKAAKASGGRSKKPALAKENVQNAAPSKRQGEEMVTISKSEHEFLMRLMQRIGDGHGALRVSPEQQFDGDLAENECDRHEYEYEDDVVLDRAVDEDQPQHVDDSTQPDFDNFDQHPYEYDDDEILEGAVGGLVQKHDENDNELVDADESNDWVAENDSGPSHLDVDAEDGDSTAPVKGTHGKMHARTWKDEGIHNII